MAVINNPEIISEKIWQEIRIIHGKKCKLKCIIPMPVFDYQYWKDINSEMEYVIEQRRLITNG